MTNALAVVLIAAIGLLAFMVPVSGRVNIDWSGLTVFLALLSPALFGVSLLQRARHLPEPVEPAIYWWAACMSVIAYTSIAALLLRA